MKIDAYGDMLFKLSFLRLQNVQDAEDVVQEVFYQYLKKPRTFQSPEHEKAWFLKVTLNGCRKIWRSAWKRHQTPWPSELGDADGGQWDPTGTEEETDPDIRNHEPEERFFRREEYRRLLQAVLALPERYKTAVYLYYYEGYSLKEIASILGCPQATVRTRLARARKQLKQMLGGDLDEE